jgi:serine/threonine protein kinase
MPGTLGKYNIMRTLGKGASCKVKLAQDPETGKKVAIKIMNDNMDPNLTQLVMTEIKAMDQLKHKHVINQIEYGMGTYKKETK